MTTTNAATVTMTTTWSTIGSAMYQLRVGHRVLVTSKSERIILRAWSNLWAPRREGK